MSGREGMDERRERGMNKMDPKKGLELVDGIPNSFDKNGQLCPSLCWCEYCDPFTKVMIKSCENNTNLTPLMNTRQERKVKAEESWDFEMNLGMYGQPRMKLCSIKLGQGFD